MRRYGRRDKGEVQVALRKKGNHRGVVIDGLVLEDLYHDRPDDGRDGGDNQWTRWALTFQCKTDLGSSKKYKDRKARETYLKDNPRFLGRLSLTTSMLMARWLLS